MGKNYWGQLVKNIVSHSETYLVGNEESLNVLSQCQDHLSFRSESSKL